MTVTDRTANPERADLLETLGKHRHFLRFTTRDLTDEHAGHADIIRESLDGARSMG